MENIKFTNSEEGTPPEVQNHGFNSALYLDVLDRLLKRIHRVKPYLRECGNWLFLNDNAPTHSSLYMTQFLAECGVPRLKDPPCSLDLAPTNFYLFPKLKLALQGRCFINVDQTNSGS